MQPADRLNRLAMSISRHSFAGLLLVSATILLAACSSGGCVETPLSPCDGGDGGGTTSVATTVTLTPASVSLSSLSETEQLNPTVTDQDGQTIAGASVSWSSSLTAIATVSPTGLVTAVSNGAATIRATSGTVTGTAAVTVQQVAAAITVSPSAVVMAGIGATATVVASVADAGGSTMMNSTLTWSSGDVNIVTVNAGLVTAVAIGVATMTVEAPSGIQAQFTVSVTSNPAVVVTTTSLADGVQGSAYSETLSAMGGDGTYTWSITNGLLPTGLILNASTGEISGTPTVAETQNFTVEVVSGDRQTMQQALSITVVALSTQGLIAYWPFNGDATDESGNGHDGTIFGATLTPDRFGAADRAFSFDGVDDYLELSGSFSSLSLPFTLSLWLLQSQLSSNPFVLHDPATPGGGYDGFWLVITGTTVSVAFGDGGPTNDASRRAATVTSTVAGAGWVHLAFTVRGPTDMSVYINGSQLPQTYSGSGGAMVHNSWPARIGRHALCSCGVAYDKVSVDDVRIYDRSVTVEEIQALFREGGWN